VFTLVDRILQLVVQLLPLHHFDWIRRARKKFLYRFVIERVTLFLEHLELSVGGRDDFWILHFLDRVLYAPRGAHQHFRKNHGLLLGLTDVKDRNPPGSTVDQIDDFIQVSGQRVNVLAVKRRHERAVDPVDGVMRQVIGLVLERLYMGDVLIELLRVLEKLVKERRRARHPVGHLCEEVVELVVAWNELQGLTPSRQA
jgi:hypothetical protein